MKGMRPRGGNLFRPVSYANLDPETRRLATFVAIARDRLPAVERSDPRMRLASYSLGAGLLGWIVVRIFFGPDWATLGALLAGLMGTVGVSARTLTHSTAQTRRRAAVIRNLDDARRSKGLDHALESPLKEQLEAYAADWEYVEHRLADRLWTSQPLLRMRIQNASQRCTERVLVGATLGDEDTMLPAEYLHDLRQCVDAATNTLDSYPRPTQEGSGAPLLGAFTEVVELEALLNVIEAEG